MLDIFRYIGISLSTKEQSTLYFLSQFESENSVCGLQMFNIYVTSWSDMFVYASWLRLITARYGIQWKYANESINRIHVCSASLLFVICFRFNSSTSTNLSARPYGRANKRKKKLVWFLWHFELYTWSAVCDKCRHRWRWPSDGRNACRTCWHAQKKRTIECLYEKRVMKILFG